MSLTENTGGEQERISFTLFSKDKGILTKRMKLAVRQLHALGQNASECRMSRGQAETVTLAPEQFGAYLQGLKPNQAIAHGICEHSKALIVSKAKETGARMKMDSPHTVPLSRQAVAILERAGRLYGKEGLIFPGRDGVKPLSENTMLYALYRMGYHSKATVHGFRAVFSTMANKEGFDGDVIEKALAHEQRNKVRAAYHRSEYLEQRRELMQWWGDLLQEMEYAQSSTEQMC